MFSYVFLDIYYRKSASPYYLILSMIILISSFVIISYDNSSRWFSRRIATLSAIVNGSNGSSLPLAKSTIEDATYYPAMEPAGPRVAPNALVTTSIPV